MNKYKDVGATQIVIALIGDAGLKYWPFFSSSLRGSFSSEKTLWKLYAFYAAFLSLKNS